MDIQDFQKFSEEIPEFLNENEKEEKLIQIVDLKHFAECYDSNMTIIDWIKNKINLVELNGNKIGILFFELKKLSQPHSFFEILHCEMSCSNQSEYEELWFVFVEENTTANFRKHIDFIEENELSLVFDKIFLFQFFQSVIHQLK